MPARHAGRTAVVMMALLAARGATAGGGGTHWVAVWGAAPSNLASTTFSDQTLRQPLTPLGDARVVRLRLSNRLGTEPVRLDHVRIGRQSAGASVGRGSNTPVRFAGRDDVTIPPAAEVLSDAVAFRCSALEHLAVSLHVAAGSGPATEHAFAAQTSYATPAGSGNHTADVNGAAFTVDDGARSFVTGLDAQMPAGAGVVVTLGDSLTDGFQAPIGDPAGVDTDARYPDFLARRLRDRGPPAYGVVNAGITGNRVLRDGDNPHFGRRALDRVTPDVLAQSGVTDVIVLEGINDLFQSPPIPPTQVIAGLKALLQQLRAAHGGTRVTILLGTLPPIGGSGYDGPRTLVARNMVNAFVRLTPLADGVVDFEHALRDPDHPARLRAEYDSGDHLHPNAAGYHAMAEAVPLELLVGRRRPAP